MNNSIPIHPEIAILTAFGTQWGSGHYQRSIAISQLWDTQAVTRYVLCPQTEVINHSSDVQGEIRDYQLHHLMRRISEQKPRILLIDRRELAPFWLSFLEKDCNIRCLLFDSVGPERSIASLLIDAIPSLQDHLPSNLRGTSYLPSVALHPDTHKAGVAVFFGFLDSKQLTKHLLRNLPQIEHCLPTTTQAPLSLSIYVGKGNSLQYVEELQRTAELLDPQKFSCQISWQIPDFFEKLTSYQLLLCHYGMSCFQAIQLKIPVLLFAASSYHHDLSVKNFPALSCLIDQSSIKTLPHLKSFQSVLDSFNSTTQHIQVGNRFTSIKNIVNALVQRSDLSHCLVCQSIDTTISHRKQHANFYFCRSCQNISLKELFPIEILDPSLKIHYDQNYFLEEYQQSYGRTYEEDKQSIYAYSASRLQIIQQYKSSGKLLDIGCALGYFLDQAKHCGFQTYGIEVSEFAAKIAQQNHVVFQKDFLQYDFSHTFDVISLWYVIEHFPNPAEVLKKIYSIQKKGDILALSTPNARGISARGNPREFFQQSPNDHYVVFSPQSLRNLCKKYGYRLLRIQSTGIHLDRFEKHLPTFSKFIPKSWILPLSNFLHLGDTFEIYLQKMY